MNTADKSITTLDVALRRRFTFEPMYPKYDLIEDDQLREIVRTLNGKILPLLEEYFFGDVSKVRELLHGLDLGGGSVKVSANGTLRFEASNA